MGQVPTCSTLRSIRVTAIALRFAATNFDVGQCKSFFFALASQIRALKTSAGFDGDPVRTETASPPISGGGSRQGSWNSSWTAGRGGANVMSRAGWLGLENPSPQRGGPVCRRRPGR